jgi:hypothetical protein
MTAYHRIRKETKDNISIYFPQQRVLGFWFHMFYEGRNPHGFSSYNAAKDAIASVQKPKVEYLEVNLND